MMNFNIKVPSFLLLALSSPVCRPSRVDALLMKNFNFGRLPPTTKEIRPDLYDLIDQQENTKLNIQLHVGDEETGFLSVNDMIVEINCNQAADDHISLPGSDGLYHSECASGHRRMDVLSKGQFINMNGSQYIDCNAGCCWEMCWVRNRPAGNIVLGFHLPKTYSRNKAILPKGDMWISFPVWTQDGLIYGQMEKKRVLNEIELNEIKRDEELDKFDMTNNPIMKAIHLNSAYSFDAKCDEMLNDYSLDTIPDSDQFSKLQENTLLSKNGLIWNKDGNDDVLLGRATITTTTSSSSSSTSSGGGRLMP